MEQQYLDISKIITANDIDIDILKSLVQQNIEKTLHHIGKNVYVDIRLCEFIV